MVDASRAAAAWLRFWPLSSHSADDQRRTCPLPLPIRWPAAPDLPPPLADDMPTSARTRGNPNGAKIKASERLLLVTPLRSNPANRQLSDREHRAMASTQAGVTHTGIR